MTTIENASAATNGANTDEAAAVARALHVVSEWVTTADHKKIGRMFIFDGLQFGLVIAVLGAVIGFDRISGTSSTDLDSGVYPQLFTLYRVGLAVFVVLPLVVGLAVAVVPLQLGAKSIAFGRAAAFGLWAWFAGAVLAIVAVLMNGGPGGKENLVVVFLAGLGISIIGLMAAMSCVVVSVLTTRAPGMNIKRVPMFAYSCLVGGVALILTLAAGAGTILLLLIDNRFATVKVALESGGFGGNTGMLPVNGTGGLWLTWMVTTPAMLVYALPLLGALPDIIGTISGRHSKQRFVMRLGIGLASLIALSAVTQRPVGFNWDADKIGDTVFTAIIWLFLSGLPILGVLIVLATTGLMIAKPTPKPKALATTSAAMVFLGGGMLLVGFLTNLVHGFEDFAVSGTTFEEGSTLYAGYGAVLIALGCVAYWGAKLTGHTLTDKKALPLAALGLLGTVLSSLPLVLAGFNDQLGWSPLAGDHGLAPGLLGVASFAGHALMALTLAAFIGLVLKELVLGGGAAAGDDPFDGQTLEWATSSPPPADNFSGVPTAASGHPLTDLKPTKAL